MKKLLGLLALSSLLLTACSSVVSDLEEAASFGMECSTDLKGNSSELDQGWKTTLLKMYPDLQVYSVGSICDLSGGEYDGSTLVTFSVSNGGEGNQRAVLFDSEQSILKESTFNCNTAGDLGVAEVVSADGDIMQLKCTSGDGPMIRIENFTLDLSSFSLTTGEVIEKEWTEEEE